MTESQDYPPPPEGEGSTDTGPGQSGQEDAPPTEQFPPGPYAGGEQAYSAYPGDAFTGGQYPPPGYPPPGYPPQWGAQQGHPEPPPQHFPYPPQEFPPQAYDRTGYAPPAAYGHPDQGFQPWSGVPYDAAAQQAGVPAARGRGNGAMIAGAVGGAVAVAAAVVLILGLVWPGFFNTDVLDTQATQHSIASVLSKDYRIDGVSAVRCPDRIEVSAGDRFTCDAVVNGRTVTVTSTFDGDDGDFVVSRPTMP